jgi:hypothetical protein
MTETVIAPSGEHSDLHEAVKTFSSIAPEGRPYGVTQLMLCEDALTNVSVYLTSRNLEQETLADQDR